MSRNFVDDLGRAQSCVGVVTQEGNIVGDTYPLPTKISGAEEALPITDATTWEPFSISASGQAFLGPAILSDLVFVGASGAVLSIYDNSSASGSALCSITLPAAISVPIPIGSIEIAVGLYVTITGTGTLMGKRKAVV